MTEKKHHFAGFWVRFMASLIDSGLYCLIFGLLLLWSFQAQAIADLIFRLFVLLIAFLIPFILLGIVYSALFTHLWGGPIGKLLAGLRTINKDGKYLNKKRSFFRQSIGYHFSGMFFWVGYFSLIKDPEKQAWHDKSVGSFVIVKQKIWPLALLVLVLLIFINGYLITTAFGHLANGPLKDEFSYLYISTKHQIDAEKESTNSAKTATSSSELKN